MRPTNVEPERCVPVTRMGRLRVAAMGVSLAEFGHVTPTPAGSVPQNVIRTITAAAVIDLRKSHH